MESTAARHSAAVTTDFSCAGESGGSGLVTGASFSADAFHSITLTCWPCGVTSCAYQYFVSTRRSGYS